MSTIKEFSVTWKEKLKRIDFIILFCVVMMSLLSILTLSGDLEKFGMRRVIIQSATILVGIGCIIVFSLLDYDTYIQKFTIPIFIFSLGALLLVNVIGQGDGNRNWIAIPGFPITIQPSEFVKIFFIITFSKHINHVKKYINHIKNVALLALHAGIIIGLVMLSGDLGSALVYIVVMAAMLFTAGLSIWYFVIVFAILLIAFPYLWPHMSEYQRGRILYGFYPEGDPIKYGYQPLLSKRAIAAGGFWGLGFSQGNVYKSLPIAESDFLFAVLAEKFGFLGGFLYMVLMSILIIRILYIARKARKDYASWICVGIVAIFIAQTLENIGMCLAMLPVIGITLPFFSYGGSSMLAMYLCIGVVESIYTHNQKYYFEREKY